MAESIRERYGRWRLEDLLLRHPGLRIVPSSGDDLILSGAIGFRLQGPDHEAIEDTYAVEIRVPPGFPKEVPTARELEGRIPKDYHKLEGDLLCLGAPTELRLRLATSPTLPAFVEESVIPYLFGHSYFVKHGVMPFGELAHGSGGILQYLAELFGASPVSGVEGFVFLASLKKRHANKYSCPCGSGRRLGRCHNRKLNQLRDRFGRRLFRDEHMRVTNHLEWLRSLAPHPKMSETAGERRSVFFRPAAR